ncbi:ABC transporter substrate-binding protein [Streptomyces sp. NPDC056480]|uniref:ABC transporter substrate-binding protein n=1 Tax=Streptomyces sp. NPDC056480 TaxID=3345833 RepID=UPI0036C260F7
MPHTMRRGLAAATAVLLGATALTACGSSDSGDGAAAGSGPVSLTYWAWAPGMDKVVALWNAEHPDIKVTVQKQASGDDLVTKIITAAKAHKAPDLVQAEYQALPTLVSNDALADIAPEVGGVQDEFAPGVWQQTTFGGEAVYALPQDSGPLMFFYRQDLFTKYGLSVPTTWGEFAATARDLKKKKSPKQSLTTFSANDSGLFAGLAQQAGARWWTFEGDTWKVGIDDAATRKVSDFWGGLVAEGAIDNQPMYTPSWNKAMNTGEQLAWVSAVWAPGTLTTAAPDTKGKWAMAPLPQWTEGGSSTGSWGGSSTAVTTDSKHKKAAAQFATWLNTDPVALAALVKESGIYPAATAAQTSGALAKAPDYFADQPDFYTRAAEIAKTTAPAAWGPNVNVAYTAFKDEFGKAAKARSGFDTALTAVQSATVTDLKKQGFEVAR